MSAPTVDPQAYRDAMSNFPTGVTVVTASTPHGPAGLAVGSFFSVSLDPVLVGFCVGNQSSSWAQMQGAQSFCVNVLAAGQTELCNRMSAKGDRWAGLDFSAAPVSGAPVFPGIVGYLDCHIHAVYEAGDHNIVIGAVQELAMEGDGLAPMVFLRRSFGTFQGAE